jgi:type 1 glutamine amidotransferase
MAKPQILILLGGQWHDFEGFASALRPILEAAGYALEISYDLEVLTRLAGMDCDLLLSYTCLSGSPEGGAPGSPTGFSRAQVKALVRWVRSGKALLAAHAATVVGDSYPDLERLLGGAFLRHPPESTFTAVPLSARYTITAGIPAFEVQDELYIERYHPSVLIHMIAVLDQVAHPIAWSKTEGRGRVVHIALGHSASVWGLEPYQRLMLQTIRWLLTG